MNRLPLAARAWVRASLLLPFVAIAATPRAALAATDSIAPAPREETGFNRPFYAGAFLGDADTRTERIERSIDAFSRMVGKRPALVKSFHRIDADFGERGWSGQMLRRIGRAGSTSYVALDLRYPGAPQRGLLDAINAGRADRHIIAAARGLAGAGTVLVEPGWEMNGRWDYGWQGVHNGGAEGPAKYRQAFQRIVDIFRREGAGNVRWVFAPNVGNPAGGAWNHYAQYNPGDRYVDFLGPHGYNSPRTWGGAWTSFESLFNGPSADRILSDLERRYPNKPIIIGEFASDEGRGGDKGRWITEAFAAIRRHRNVVGAIWFNMRKEADWRVDSSRESLDAYRAVMRDPNVRASFRG
jgi:hypothetical protein